MSVTGGWNCHPRRKIHCRSLAAGGGAHCRLGAGLPAVGHRRTGRRAISDHAQNALDDLGFGGVVTANVSQPTPVEGLVIDPVQAAGYSAGERERNLRAESGSEMNGKLHRVASAATQVERSQFGVNLAEVRHWRDDAVFEDFHRDHVFNADAHWVAGEALGVGYDDAAGGLAECMAERRDLGRGAAPASRGICLVGHEHGLRSDGVTVQAKPALGGGDQTVHHHRDVVDVQPCAVEGAVARLAAQQFDDAAHAALANGILALDDQRARAHPHDGPVPPPIERQCCLGYLILRRRRADGQETGADPFHEMVSGDVVCANDDDAAATAAADPVLGDGHALGRAGAGRVHVSVGAASADVLRELAVTHGQDAEQEAAVEDIWLSLQLVAEIADTPVDLAEGGRIGGVVTQILQHFKLLA